MVQQEHLGRLHRKLGADYDGPDGLPPPRPRWMRHRTYDRVVQQIEAGEDRLNAAFMIGAERFLARVEKSALRRGKRHAGYATGIRFRDLSMG
jgi:hypothetical protein